MGNEYYELLGVEKDASEEEDNRPFPSRLLRKNRLQE